MARRRKPRTIPAAVRVRRHGPAWLAVLIALLAAAGYLTGDRRAGPSVDFAEPERTYEVERVVDGDTLVLVGGERLRLLGVDTPETVAPGRRPEPFGFEASRYTKQMAEGKTVRLGFDKERRDRYDRLLVYVYVDGRLLNEELIRAGWSEAQLQYPYSDAMKRRFRAAEDDAREAGRGIWGSKAASRGVRAD